MYFLDVHCANSIEGNVFSFMYLLYHENEEKSNFGRGGYAGLKILFRFEKFISWKRNFYFVELKNQGRAREKVRFGDLPKPRPLYNMHKASRQKQAAFVQVYKVIKNP